MPTPGRGDIELDDESAASPDAAEPEPEPDVSEADVEATLAALTAEPSATRPACASGSGS